MVILHWIRGMVPRKMHAHSKTIVEKTVKYFDNCAQSIIELHYCVHLVNTYLFSYIGKH